MKIKDILPQTASLPVSKRGDIQGREGVDFHQFLKGATARRVGEDGKVSLSSSGHTSEIHSISGSPELNQADPCRQKGIEAAERTLGVLQEYQKAIGDPRTTLRHIQSTIHLLSLEVKNLNGMAENIPSTDPLHKILSELGIVSAIEIEKFNRGEYV